VARLTATDARALARALRALPAEARLEELARRAPAESWERRFAEALREAEGERARVAAANELIAEAEHRIQLGAGWPAAATRLCALGALLITAAAYLAGAGPAVLGAVVVIGAAGAMASAGAGRAGRAEAERQRGAIDALVAAAVGPLAEEPPEAPGPRRSPRGHSPRGQRRP
jgi:Flp pilus assembly protein TadB